MFSFLREEGMCGFCRLSRKQNPFFEQKGDKILYLTRRSRNQKGCDSAAAVSFQPSAFSYHLIIFEKH